MASYYTNLRKILIWISLFEVFHQNFVVIFYTSKETYYLLLNYYYLLLRRMDFLEIPVSYHSNRKMEEAKNYFSK